MTSHMGANYGTMDIATGAPLCHTDAADPKIENERYLVTCRNCLRAIAKHDAYETQAGKFR